MLGATAPALAFDIERTVTAQAIPSPRQGLSDAYIVSFGLFGPESVFESEARGAARVLQAWFEATVEPVVRFNSKRRAFATARTGRREPAGGWGGDGPRQGSLGCRSFFAR